MKKGTIRLLPLLLCVALLLCGCSKAPVLDVDAKTGSFTNSKTGVTYQLAPDCYEAISVLVDRSVARIKYDGLDDVTLYEMEFVDPVKMIASKEGEVFYAKGTELPTLAQMACEKIYVGQVGGAKDYAVAIISSAEDVDALVDIYQNAVPFPEKEMLDDTLSRTRYDLRFYSSLYPSFYYRVTYWQFTENVLVYEVIESMEGFVSTYPSALDVTFEQDGDELCAVYHFGKGLLYDRETKLCYPVGEIVSSYLTENK